MVGHEEYCKLRIMQATYSSRPIHSAHLSVSTAHIASLFSYKMEIANKVYLTEAHYKETVKLYTNDTSMNSAA